MNIALCTDENFVVPALVCLVSILENNRSEEMDLYIITDGISDASESKFSKLADVYKASIHVVVIDNSRFKTLKTIGRFRISMFYRFLIPEILKEADRCLYLDCDIIVRKCLKEFYETDLNDKACAVVADNRGDSPAYMNRVNTEGRYFNSGVLLMNLKYWRAYDIANKLVQYIDNNPDGCIFPDQDGLNAVLRGKVVWSDYTNNLQHLWLKDLNSAEILKRYHDDIRRAAKDPVIVHFCSNAKPWHYESENPFTPEFLEYAKKYDFVGFRLTHLHTPAWRFANFLLNCAISLRYKIEKYHL